MSGLSSTTSSQDKMSNVEALLNTPKSSNNNTKVVEILHSNRSDRKSSYDISIERSGITENNGGPVRFKNISDTPRGFINDPSLLFDLYTLESNGGNSDSTYSLALCYKNGTGCEVNLYKSLELLEKAAHYRNTKALYALAHVYLNGRLVVERDYKRALELFTLATENGHIDATYDLGMIYLTGLGKYLPIQRANGIKLLEFAASQNHRFAKDALLADRKINRNNEIEGEERLYYTIEEKGPRTSAQFCIIS